jgi:hypothetical protein
LPLVLPQIATDEKSNEIAAVPKLLKMLCLKFKGTIRAFDMRQMRPQGRTSGLQGKSIRFSRNFSVVADKAITPLCHAAVLLEESER